MKATGIVRRIDDLGRVVVPKEIRRTLRIREGEPLEIFTEKDGEIILKKYSPIGELGQFAKQYAEALAQSTGYTVSITDRDQHIAVSGNGKKELLGKSVSKQLERVMASRENIVARHNERKFVTLSDDLENCFLSQVICPIIAEGDAVGSVIITTKSNQSVMGDMEKCLASTAAGFLGRQLEQ